MEKNMTKHQPLHTLVAEERIEICKEVLEKNNVPKEKWAFVSYMMGVQEEHAINAGVNLEKLDEDNGNVTGDINVVAKMMSPMITRGFAQSAATEICGLWPMQGDQGKIAYMRNFYTEDMVHPVKPVNGKIFIVGDSSAFTEDGVVTGQGGGKGIPRYIEGNAMFVEITSGSFSNNEKLDNVDPYVSEKTTITKLLPTEVGPYVFSNYSKFATIALGENASADIKEIELGIDLANVTAEDHKMRMRFTREMGAKLKSYYGLDADVLTDNIAAMAFKQELNRRVFKEVFDAATIGGSSTWAYDTDPDGRWELEKIKNLMTKLNFSAANILQSNFIDQGNYIVIDSILYAFFNSYGYLDMTDVPGKMAQPMKNAFVGVLNGSFRTYVNPWMYTQAICMGMKDFSGGPEAETRAGLFFHPYLGLDITKTVHSDTGQPVKFLWSMYGFTLHPLHNTVGTNDFFRRINPINLPDHT